MSITSSTTVLCIDDSDAILFVCQKLLESVGYRVLTAENGRDGLELLQRHAVDVAVIDNEMPGMMGAQLACEMKALQRNMPVLMFSGSPQPDRTVPIDDFVMKSEGPAALLKALYSLLN